MNGTLKDLSFTRKGENILEITTRESCKKLWETLGGQEITFTIKKRAKPRSLNANAYYRRLCYQLAAATNVSTNCMHNMLLRRYGVPEEIDGELLYAFLPDTDEAEERALEMETLHLKPTSNVRDGTDGNRYRAYYVIKGTHDYDTREMSILINGVVDECREVGIETLTPDKLALMLGGERR